MYAEKEVLHLAEIVLAYGCIDLYVLLGVDELNVVPMIDTSAQESQQHRRKITPKRPTFHSVAPNADVFRTTFGYV